MNEHREKSWEQHFGIGARDRDGYMASTEALGVPWATNGEMYALWRWRANEWRRLAYARRAFRQRMDDEA